MSDTLPTIASPTAKILAFISAHWRVPEHVILGHSRIRHVALARHIAMYALRQAGLSYPVIARELNLQDHTTVMHGVKKIELLMWNVPIGDPTRLAICDLVKLAQEQS